jgi:hypothetical protein
MGTKLKDGYYVIGVDIDNKNEKKGARRGRSAELWWYN